MITPITEANAGGVGLIDNKGGLWVMPSGAATHHLMAGESWGSRCHLKHILPKTAHYQSYKLHHKWWKEIWGPPFTEVYYSTDFMWRY